MSVGELGGVSRTTLPPAPEKFQVLASIVSRRGDCMSNDVAGQQLRNLAEHQDDARAVQPMMVNHCFDGLLRTHYARMCRAVPTRRHGALGTQDVCRSCGAFGRNGGLTLGIYAVSYPVSLNPLSIPDGSNDAAVRRPRRGIHRRLGPVTGGAFVRALS